MTVREYEVSNLNCADCGNKIEAGIQALSNVNRANLDFMAKKLTVEYRETVDNHLIMLNNVAASIDPAVEISEAGELSRKKQALYAWLPLAAGLAVIIASQFLPLPWKSWLGLAAYLLVGYRVLQGAAHSIVKKQVFSEKLLMSLATIGAVILGEFPEAVAVMLLYQIGQWLEDRAVEHSRRSVRGLLSLKPELAHLKSGGDIVDKQLAEIQIGDLILVYPGERVPLDGSVTSGESTVDTSTLTGETEPYLVSPGSQIYAGFMNNNSLLEIQVSSLESDSTVSKILQLIDNATAKKSSREKFISRFARYYTPIVVGLALLVFAIPTLAGFSAAVWFKRALVFLIVSCPCALVISIPLTYYIAIGIAARKGIILKGSVYLDAVREVDTVVFDKTGTVTTGDMSIERIFARDETLCQELEKTLYLSEYTSSHPFAKAIKKSFSADYDGRLVNAYSEYPGRGILVLYDKDRLMVGSAEFLQSFGFVNLEEVESASVVHAAKNDVYLGCVCFGDELKEGVKQALQELRQLGVKRNVMLSGDKKSKAKKVSEELGFDSFHAELLPSQKLEILEQLMQAIPGRVAFVGDGMNDAPSIARADVGIAMGGIGSQVSVESADVILMQDHPRQLTALFQISQKTGRFVAQNITLALAIKVLVMALGVGGISGLWEAIIADVGVTLLVIFNSLRMTGWKSRT